MSTNQTAARARRTVSAPDQDSTEDAREAVNGAFDALSDWRQELTEVGERHSSLVFGKMAEAAKAMGWPTEIVETARSQMEGAAKLHVQIIDQVLDMWEQQLKQPGSKIALPSPEAMLESFKQLPAMRLAGDIPGLSGLPPFVMNPFQLWLEMAGQWQRMWATAIDNAMESRDKLAAKGNGTGRPGQR